MRRTALFKFSVATIAASISTIAMAADPDSCKTVKMSEPGWADIQATNSMVEVVLEALGYTPKVDNLSVPITFRGLQMGQTDVFLGNWMPAQKPMVEGSIKDGSIEVMQTNLPQAKFTLAVPAYVAAAGVKSFNDLQKNADKFENKIYGIEAGAPANRNIQNMLIKHDFGLKDWKLVESSEAGMLSQVSRKIADKAWIVFLAWEPHMMNTKFKISYLADGDAYFGPNYGSASVHTVSRKGFAKQCPNLGKLFTQIKFNVDMENDIITDVLDKKQDAKVAAKAALKANPQLVASWLAGVQTTTGGDGLAAVKQALAK
ncbi:choline ABC transporter substrate-binding protein [Leeia sp. TBRC 13508]|uniref:Choline ABC transporter substrate-binding protein n=1 Tax=Leeia speluncae TaxID=2884804 RepID=A0ABS8D9B5_9NEIS|nr:choline ABC transporter substrate-binding protein [Leeia speluncae]MCB6184806.1 choline ABC transporter substrate-binding protein [Leeia speluncae]